MIYTPGGTAGYASTQDAQRQRGLMSQGLTFHRKTFTRIAAGTAITLALTLAPVLILTFAPSGADWGKLSDVSQVYAAFLSAVAVLGVAAALVYQARQTALAHAESARVFHRELMTMTLNDPTFMVCWAPNFTAFSIEEARQIIFTNLIVSEWFSQYQLHQLNDDAILELFLSHFRGEVARKHWEISRGSRRQLHTTQGDLRGMKFVSIVDKAFTQAVTEGPAIPASAYFAPGR
ncbi:DUF6082 family protein [Streptomyces sp900105245]|uniref:DUF6082 family protein n=1 Tax=Streptomyces sp. 900105245 TaxID=3154379 RepID=UPI00332DC2D7